MRGWRHYVNFMAVTCERRETCAASPLQLDGPHSATENLSALRLLERLPLRKATSSGLKKKGKKGI